MPQAVISRLEEEEEEGEEESGFEDLCEDLLCKSWKVFDRCDLVKEQVYKTLVSSLLISTLFYGCFSRHRLRIRGF